MNGTQGDIIVTNGFAMCYYCFDAGYEIPLSHIEKIRGKTARRALLTCSRLTPSYIQYKVPPLLIRLGRKKVRINEQEFSVTIDAKVYDFGVIVVRITIPISGSLEQLNDMSIMLNDCKALRKKAVTEFDKIIEDIQQVIIKPRMNSTEDIEDYVIFMIREFDHAVTVIDLLEDYSIELARILRCEKNLSCAEMSEALKNPLSYYDNDLTLVDWNSAVICDPNASYDVPDIIEFALIQLLELRLYDHMLDEIIDGAYDALVPLRYRIFPFSRTLQNLLRIKLDISEIVDRLFYHLKLIGDVYLAKVYETASKRFYVEHWKSAVRSKLATIESIYRESWSRIQTNRMIVLELAIVILFVIDILLILIELF
ncbi:hypothetical protein JXB22_10620 [candidate division WOR-3 bacterium]|nr:hypothetical protein [candidate division WOR-3 bacterium]